MFAIPYITCEGSTMENTNLGQRSAVFTLHIRLNPPQTCEPPTRPACLIPLCIPASHLSKQRDVRVRALCVC